jgi:MFS family permease
MNVQRLSPAQWRLLALLTLSVIINFIDRGNLSTAAPLLKDELGFTTAQLGILLSSFFWAYAGFMIVAGWLADRLDANWVLAGGFLVWCAATVATGFAHNLTALLIARLALGMGGIGCMAMLLQHFGAKFSRAPSRCGKCGDCGRRGNRACIGDVHGRNPDGENWLAFSVHWNRLHRLALAASVVEMDA